jgi:DNA-directed RNA polymerase subunit RPC12/RpoP
MDEATPYACPTCGAEYKVVRVEAKTMVPEGRLTCTKCGGPLHAREGRYILKYFLVGGSRRYPLRLAKPQLGSRPGAQFGEGARMVGGTERDK